MIEVKNQEQLDKALKDHPNELIACVGNGFFSVTGSSSVVARGSSSVEARESSRVEAWESSSVEARGSSSVVARESSRVVARGSSSVVAGAYVPVQRHGKTAKVKGGVLIQIPEIKTAQEWCDYYGVKVVRGIATLYKAVDDDYATGHSRGKGIFYTPGAKPAAPDWDNGVAECGGGLHFTASPSAAKYFNDSATRYVACPVKLIEIVVHKNPSHPTKIKAPRVYGPCVEVDLFGDPVKAKSKAA